MTALTNIDLYELISPHQIRAYIEQSGQWEKQPHDKYWYKDCEWKHTATGTELHIDPHWNEHGTHNAYPYRVKENIELIAKLHGKTTNEVFEEILKKTLETVPSAPVQETTSVPPQYFYAVWWTLDGVCGLWPKQFGTFKTPQEAREAIKRLVAPEHQDRYQVVRCEVVL